MAVNSMDFPLYHLDFFGNRLLIAVIAITHVYINHALAVGALPLITLMEWWGWKKSRPDWDQLAYRILAVCFFVTTSVGAMTGVGIWFSAALVNPAAIGNLIRVFFAAWFTEWIVFVIEVVSIIAYYLTWKRMSQRKGRHILLGAFLSINSWLTMAVIVAILSFMMEPGAWSSNRSFWSGVFNPLYLPQLSFRTPLAMSAAGLFAIFLIFFFTRREPALRAESTRLTSLWVLGWLPLLLAGALWYRSAIPGWIVANVPVAVATQSFVSWYQSLAIAIAAGCGIALVVVLWGAALPRRLPRAMLLVPFVLILVLLGLFERVREFVRKPYAISGYLYSNGLRVSDYPLFKQQGLLAHATFASTRAVTPENRIQAGRDVFMLACTRCHTTSGLNGILKRLTNLYGPGPWDRDTIKAYVGGMHLSRPYMPPFPGTDKELGALADYVMALRDSPSRIEGAQTAGVALPAAPQPAAPAPQSQPVVK